MTAHLLLVLALTEPVAGSTAPPLYVSQSLAVVPWSAAELRAACRNVVVRSVRPETFVPARDVPELVLYRAAVAQSQTLSRTERIQTIRRIDYCLDKALAQLKRLEARLKKQSGRASAVHMESSARAPSLAGGAAEARQVQQLISLIEATIAPDTWEANGGLGVIQYWQPGYALVVRNSQAVHEELGGLLRELRSIPR